MSRQLTIVMMLALGGAIVFGYAPPNREPADHTGRAGDDAKGPTIPEHRDSVEAVHRSGLCEGEEDQIGQPCDSPDDVDTCESGVFECSAGTLVCTDDAAIDDEDGDGVWDCNDACQGNNALIGDPCDSPADVDNCESGIYECSTGVLNCTDDALVDDADADGIMDCDDTCIGDNALIGQPCDSPADADSCASAPYDCKSGTLTCLDDDALDDSDGDGIWDCDDTCIGDDSLIDEPCDTPFDADDCESGLYDCDSGVLSCSDDALLDDADADGVWDCHDTCQGDNSEIGQPCDSVVDIDGCPSGVWECSTEILLCTDDDALDDADADGIVDCDDTCVGNDAAIGQPCDNPEDVDDCLSGEFDCSTGVLTCTDDAALDDLDADGVWDCHDSCVGDQTLIGNPCDASEDEDDCESGVFNCASGTLTCTDDVFLDDEDADGVWDCHDVCPGTAIADPVNAEGCSCEQLSLKDPGDADDDGISDCLDLCPGTAPNDPVDATGCSCAQLTPKPPFFEDMDSDTIPDVCDNCPDTANTDQMDTDDDGVGDACDVCENGDDALIGQPCDGTDVDDCLSGERDCSTGVLTCTDDEALDDSDGDGVWDCLDLCVGDDTQIGNPCDSPDDADDCESGVFDCTSETLTCTDDALLDDEDADGVWDCHDNCPGSSTADPVDVNGCSCEQLGLKDTVDADDDGISDCRDFCPGTAPAVPVGSTGCSCAQLTPERALVEDMDSDSVPDVCDNCPDTPNTDQSDSDGDAIGDACDDCDGDDSLLGQPCDSPIDADDCLSGVYECSSGSLLCSDDDESDDSDADGVCDADDVCPGFDDAPDADGDKVPDGCDNCPDHANTNQADCDLDGTGDVCAIADNLSEDCDGDGLPDACAFGQRAKLTASNANASDWFGNAVSVSGNISVVGAYQSDCTPSAGCGAAYVYRFDGTEWLEEAKLTASDAAQNDWFGYAVSISGTTIVVGAYKRDCAEDINCGAVYVYRFDGTLWLEEAKLTASDAATEDQLGYSVSISGDLVVAGARYDDCTDGIRCGATYLFEKPAEGWVDMTETAKLTASDAAAVDWFGYAVSSSGDTVAVTARLVDCAAGIDCGAVYVFEKPVTGWEEMNETAKLTASDQADSSELGAAVSMSGDVVVVGAGSDGGVAYVFQKPVAGWIDVTETARLTAADADGTSNFGFSASVDDDTIVVSARLDDCAAGAECGAAYVFRRPATGWADTTETAKLTADDADDRDWFGFSVSVSGDTAIVGAQLDNCPPAFDCGSAYVFAVGSFDCNANGTPDDCDIESGASEDCNANSIPDECEPDSDNDGILDACDACDGDDALIGQSCDGSDEDDCASGIYNCSTETLLCSDDAAPDDEDADGVFDCLDVCPGTAVGLVVDAEGCPPDGACCLDPDICVNDTSVVDCLAFGGVYLGPAITCEGDPDNDGALGCADSCPLDQDKTEPGVCGCSEPDVDTDADTVFDCFDLCPDTPLGAPVDEDGCSLLGACCAAAGGCLDNVAETACVAVSGTYQGHRSACDAGCVFGDFDGDGDTDLVDASMFCDCFTGTGGGPIMPECLEGDFDADGDIDVTDAKWFTKTFSGP